mmetsp:Transcript_9021/g.31040  ORF Transcript_9021/g.31040 Transcript_9021/m.31040 type:complete len:306 (-) Transcript_9021:56-973(-)|eukprot:CAMPEP_0196647090 /NCGR_PEP_ID=MMETSP1085-20130531/11415_1 /TAXON_ID=41879 ORGANISM="Pycnococcus sp, Strain CCMP1998" /NCGR_SAMPLE_ID=MMETSP1085 /ASSEMBLY_ACC=CAM_ASM_000807 /LENGTH=305 /DNA_ID=CAMNT_0041976809 /DNA_START=587 /DNA_END=1501 /DNA_ORIENTATION=+
MSLACSNSAAFILFSGSEMRTSSTIILCSASLICLERKLRFLTLSSLLRCCLRLSSSFSTSSFSLTDSKYFSISLLSAARAASCSRICLSLVDLTSSIMLDLRILSFLSASSSSLSCCSLIFCSIAFSFSSLSLFIFTTCSPTTSALPLDFSYIACRAASLALSWSSSIFTYASRILSSSSFCRISFSFFAAALDSLSSMNSSMSFLNFTFLLWARILSSSSFSLTSAISLASSTLLASSSLAFLDLWAITWASLSRLIWLRWSRLLSALKASSCLNFRTSSATDSASAFLARACSSLSRSLSST